MPVIDEARPQFNSNQIAGIPNKDLDLIKRYFEASNKLDFPWINGKKF